MEPFTWVEETHYSGRQHRLFDDVRELQDSHTADHDLQYVAILRKANPTMIVTTVPINNVNLRSYAAAGFATYTLDTDSDSFSAWRGFLPVSSGLRGGSLGEAVHFAKYNYFWRGDSFILYLVNGLQYILKARRGSEDPLGPSQATDELILAAGSHGLDKVVWVYDNYWYADKKLYQEVEKASWEKVILEEKMKEDLVNVSRKFFESKEVYDDLGVPWKRGLLFHGPPGNGKTISIKALMHTLLDHTPDPIPTLYVKNAPNPYHINNVFRQARSLAPCMLVLEDVETIVTPATRSYFFNQMDGLEDNSGLFVVASTNFLDRLDPGLTERPSRFDRKYLFPLPNEHERMLYAEFWRAKLHKGKSEVEFPQELCPKMAEITGGFSFAFLQECFVATLLELASRDEEKGKGGEEKEDPLDKYELWRGFKAQVKILRKQIHSDDKPASSSSAAAASASLVAVPSPSTSAAIGLSADARHASGAAEMQGPQGDETATQTMPEEQHWTEEMAVRTADPNERRLGHLPSLGIGKRMVVNTAALMTLP